MPPNHVMHFVKGRSITHSRICFLIVSLVVLIAGVTSSTVSVNAAPNFKNELKEGSCGYIRLTNGGDESYVEALGAGADLVLGPDISKWCVAYPSPGVIKFHHRVDGTASNMVIAEHYHRGEDVVILEPNGLDNEAEQWFFAGETKQDDWTNAGNLNTVLTHADAPNFILHAGTPQGGDWSNWGYICVDGCS